MAIRTVDQREYCSLEEGISPTDLRTDLERGKTRAGEPQLPCSVLEGPFRLVHPAEGEPDGTALSLVL